MLDMLTIRQFSRYATVGLASNITLYLAYLAITSVGVGHKLSMSALYVTGVIITFFVNRKWSFAHDGLAHTAFVRYVIAYIIGYFINLLILFVYVDKLAFPHQAVQAAAIFIVAISLFLMHKFWVFAQPADNH